MGYVDGKIDRLTDYCAEKGITIHSSIQPRHVKGCGLGVYATEHIAAGERLIHVPTAQIFSTLTIPESFLDKGSREGVAVHAQLAAFFAFGDETDLEQYQPWLKTWPALADFYETMPMFWGEYITEQLRVAINNNPEPAIEPTASPVHKKRKLERESSHSRKPSTADGKGIDLRTLTVVREQAAEMVKKLSSHIQAVSAILPHVQLLDDRNKIVKFLHAWCLVNTRCFYYIPSEPTDGKGSKTKIKPPADPNEAMGLCPFMDLFNHTAPPISTPSMDTNRPAPPSQTPCTVRCNSVGFAATTTSEIEAGKEIMFSYGAHTNDTLWSEYGFMLPGSSNNTDSTLLDDVIMVTLTASEKAALEEHSYLGTYTLFNDGSICYRTEVAAWLKVLGPQMWTKAMEEGFDLGDLVLQIGHQATLGDDRSSNAGESTDDGPGAGKRYCEVIQSWLSETQEQAQKDLEVLESMEGGDILEMYKTLSMVAEAENISAERQLHLGRTRHRMCLQRCEQICGMALRGVEVVTAEVLEEA